jgi:hypothetical protein
MTDLPDDPITGRPIRGGDRRAEFERLSRENPRDLEAERAFIRSKIEIVQSDLSLSEDEKAKIIAELRDRAGLDDLA